MKSTQRKRPSPRTTSEAWDYVYYGIKALYRLGTMKTRIILTLVLIWGSIGPGYLGWQYLSERALPRMEINKAEPISDNVDWSVIPKAYAIGDEQAIYIKGKLYGYSDPNYQVWKLENQWAFLVLNINTGEIQKVGDTRTAK